MTWEAIAAALAGTVVLGASIIGARRPTIPAAERRVFRVLNGLPGWLFGLLWLPMQLGNLVVGVAVGLGVAWVVGSTTMALAVLLAAALKLVAERVLRHATRELLVTRQRPGTSQPGAVLRGADVPATGPSFPSGHVILAFALACVLAVGIPKPWDALPFLLAALVAVGRVYVGAHNPLDVTAGLGLGLLVGAVAADLLVTL